MHSTHPNRIVFSGMPRGHHPDIPTMYSLPGQLGQIPHPLASWYDFCFLYCVCDLSHSILSHYFRFQSGSTFLLLVRLLCSGDSTEIERMSYLPLPTFGDVIVYIYSKTQTHRNFKCASVAAVATQRVLKNPFILRSCIQFRFINIHQNDIF